MTQAAPAATQNSDLDALARGGRTNVIGFLLRLAARIPFLFIAGRLYGAEALGRFAYAVLVVEFAAQVATLGLKRGLAHALAHHDKDAPDSHIVYDALLLTLFAAVCVAVPLILLPQAMFPNSAINDLDRLLPLVVLTIALADVALAACAYRYDIAATVRARSLIEPWTISIAAFALFFYSARDGLILSYVASMLAALVAAIVPLLRHFGLPRGWSPNPSRLAEMAMRYLPLAAADAIEWGTRRLDLAILGLFASPAVVGIYYVAQQVASLPQKLKTSFEPILGPVIARNVAAQNHGAIAAQVSQVGFWIIAAQLGVALALGIPGEGVMGLVGPLFVGGTGVLAFLLMAEVLAAPAVVSEAALVYLARHRNLAISIGVIALQALLTLLLVWEAKQRGLPELWIAACPALALCLALAVGSLVKTLFLGHLLDAKINSLRSSLSLAAIAAIAVGAAFVALPPQLEWVELAIGIPAILVVYGVVLWRVGFGPEDRALFRKASVE